MGITERVSFIWRERKVHWRNEPGRIDEEGLRKCQVDQLLCCLQIRLSNTNKLSSNEPHNYTKEIEATFFANDAF